MSVFERYLSVWVGLCIVVGIALGQLLPGPVQALGRMEFAQVNLPAGMFISAVKLFSMALLAWIFIRHMFAPYLPAGQIDSYVAG